MLARAALAFVFLSAVAGLAACEPKASPPVESTGVPAVGGPFSLIDQDGKPVTEKVLLGKWSVIYFGYTYCPDVCPTSLQVLAQGLDRMGRKGQGVQTFLISVDPERDTPAQMKTYIASPAFPKNLVGLTGTPQAVADAAKGYKFFYKKTGDGPGYLVDHYSIMYLMDPQGHLARPLTHGLTPEEIQRQITDAMKRGPKAQS